MIVYFMIAALAAAVLVLCYQFARLRRKFLLLQSEFRAHRGIYNKIVERLKELENGLIPDYEAAKEAVKSVNDFNTGLAAIMGYDPMEAAKKAREKQGDA